jgi:hypothetical protein
VANRRALTRLRLAHEALERFQHMASEHTADEVEDARAYIARLIDDQIEARERSKERWRKKRGGHALTPTQVRMLRALEADPFAWHAANFSTLRALLRKGMIRRTRTPTGTAVYKLTEKGRDRCKAKERSKT